MPGGGTAGSDQGAALIKFKADRVSAADSRNYQVAIELFHVPFATVHWSVPSTPRYPECLSTTPLIATVVKAGPLVTASPKLVAVPIG
jgi:hypothetical protein